MEMLARIFTILFFSSLRKQSRSGLPSKNRHHNGLVFSLIFIGLCVPSISLANTKDSAELDVVLLMDSSGSMKRNDPQDLRKPAAELFISLLSKGDNASVVSFSDKGYPVAFLTPVKGKKNEKKLFASVEKISTRGVYTNLHGALKTAQKVLNKSKQKARKKLIILMSDGKMDLGDEQTNEAKTKLIIDQLLPELKQQDIAVQTIAFTDQSDKVLLQNIAETSGGHFHMAQTDDQLHNVYTAIFEQSKAPNSLPFNGEKFNIDKSIKEVTIVGSKESRDIALSLKSPNGNIYTADDKPSNIKWFVSEKFDLITVPQPVVGGWAVQASNGKNKAYIITDLKMQLDIDKPKPIIGEGVFIRSWLEEKSQVMDKPDVLSTVDIKLNIKTPDDQTHVLDMETEPNDGQGKEQKGKFASHIAFPAPGDYQITIALKSSTFSRERTSVVTVLEDTSGVETASSDQQKNNAKDHNERQKIEPHQEKTVENSHIQSTDANTSHPSIDEQTKSSEHTTNPDDKNHHETSVVSDHETIDSKTDHSSEKDQHTHVEDNKTEAEMQSDAHLKQESLHSKPSKTSASKKITKKTKKTKKDKKQNKKDKKRNKKGKKSAKDKHKESDESDSSLLKGVLAFIGVNLVLLLIGGIAFFIHRKKKRKAAESADGENSNDADKEKG